MISLGLATWRLSYMLTSEAGPNDMFTRLREISGVQYDDETGNVVSWNDWSPLVCLWCTSVYAAGILALVPRTIVSILAASGIAVIIDKCLSSAGGKNGKG